MANKKFRELHIDDEIWGYVIDPVNNWEFDGVHTFRVYEPNKKMHRLDSKDLGLEGYLPKIKPSDIKNYIIKNLKHDKK